MINMKSEPIRRAVESDTPIQSAWEDFLGRVLKPAGMTEEEVVRIRDAFYIGSLTMWALIHEGASPGHMQKEITAFYNEKQKRGGPWS